MRVLLTGAFGSLGSLVLETLLQHGYPVIAFDVKSRSNLRIAKSFEHRPDTVIDWGDIRDRAQVSQLVQQVDAVIHLAAIIVPFSENNPEMAYDVNVLGTRNVVDSIQAMEHKPLLAYCSSFAVFGPQGRPPPRTLNETPIATDHYSQHKIACEDMVKRMQSPWVILRLGGMADSRMRHRGLDQAKYALSMAAMNRFEYIHPQDAATAFVNSLSRTEAHNQIHLIGGGPDCQVTHRDVLNAALGAIGITLAESDFGRLPLYADWADTSESQRLLCFQHHSFESFRRENYQAFRFMRPFVQPFAPLIKRLLKLSVRF